MIIVFILFYLNFILNLHSIHSLNRPLNRIFLTNQKDNSWNWNDQEINYVKYTSNKKQALLLIHGFGASHYHWRYNICELSKYYDVYAFDLLGFGKSSKKTDIEYNVDLWKEQTDNFINEVIKKNTTIIGNSLGGNIALHSMENNYVNSIVLLNAFLELKDNDTISVPKFIINWGSWLYFKFFARETQIKNTLLMLYPENPSNVDENLIHSIINPTKEKNAQNVLNNIIFNMVNSNNTITYQNEKNKNKPMLIISGIYDRWINNNISNTILTIYPNSKRVYVNSGHCPQDEMPILTNDLIHTFISMNKNIN